MHINAVLCVSVPSAQIGGLPMKLAPKVIYFTTDYPELAGKRLVRALQRTQFRAKSAKNDLKPTDFLRLNFYFETEGVPLMSV